MAVEDARSVGVNDHRQEFAYSAKRYDFRFFMEEWGREW